MEDLTVLTTEPPRVNYRYLKWSEKSESSTLCRCLLVNFLSRAAEDSVPFEYFRFDLKEGVYRMTDNHGPIVDSAMTIIATVPSGAMDTLLTRFDLELAGHLRGTGVSEVFDFPVAWPGDLEPGPSDVLLVIRNESPFLFTLMQRRIVTPKMVEEMRGNSGGG